jgi:subtilisin family serine protease
VLVEIDATSTDDLEASIRNVGPDLGWAHDVGFQLDESFPYLTLPAEGDLSLEAGLRVDANLVGGDLLEAVSESRLIRGSMPLKMAIEAARLGPGFAEGVRAIHSDPVIGVCDICPDSPSVGNLSDVTRRMCVDELSARGLFGDTVVVALVDGGINVDALRSAKSHLEVDLDRSTSAPGADAPGRASGTHGAMCAFQVGIAAPKATLLDISILKASRRGLTSLLSEAVIAYNHLRQIQRDLVVTGGSLVISNSWAVYDPRTDFPDSAVGNYGANPGHAFNRLVDTIVSEGADVLFAAGNCGGTCRDERCRFARGAPTVLGANALSSVLSVGAVGVDDEPVGYSSLGGTIDPAKPDVLGFAHYAGSGIEEIDSGTSVACPQIAGLVAAIRQVHSVSSLPGSQLRDLVRTTSKGGSVDPWRPGTIEPMGLLDAIS